MALAAAAAHVLAERDRSHRPVAVVGRDPRASGEMLEAAVVAGLTAAGADALRVGVLPTPAVAYLAGALDADLGVMISASHNAMPDNGIKIFAAGGHKLADAVEDAVEERRRRRPGDRPTGAAIGRVRDLPDDAHARYADHLLARHARPARRADASSSTARTAPRRPIAPEVYRRAGAEVIAIAAEPDGLNINDGVGSTHLDLVRRAVLEHGADLGIAHDGDADRCLAVDASGADVDGDAILAILALAMRDAGELAANTLVATVMSNLGLHLAMRDGGHRRCAPPRSATATCSRSCARAVSRSAASSPGTSSCPRTPPPATACSPRCG